MNTEQTVLRKWATRGNYATAEMVELQPHLFEIEVHTSGCLREPKLRVSRDGARALMLVLAEVLTEPETNKKG